MSHVTHINESTGISSPERAWKRMSVREMEGGGEENGGEREGGREGTERKEDREGSARARNIYSHLYVN